MGDGTKVKLQESQSLIMIKYTGAVQTESKDMSEEETLGASWKVPQKPKPTAVGRSPLQIHTDRAAVFAYSIQSSGQ